MGAKCRAAHAQLVSLVVSRPRQAPGRPTACRQCCLGRPWLPSKVFLLTQAKGSGTRLLASPADMCFPFRSSSLLANGVGGELEEETCCHPSPPAIPHSLDVGKGPLPLPPSHKQFSDAAFKDSRPSHDKTLPGSSPKAVQQPSMETLRVSCRELLHPWSQPRSPHSVTEQSRGTKPSFGA